MKEHIWESKTLDELAEFINGYPFKPTDWKTTGLPIIRIAQMTESQKDQDYFDGKISERYLVEKGDLLFSWSGTLKTMFWHKGNGWLNQHIFKVVTKADVDKQYFYFLLDSVIEDLKMRSHGSTMKHIKGTELKDFFVKFPPLPEQKKIAEILTSVDNVIDLTTQEIEKLKDLKKGMMQELLTKGIGHTKFKDSPVGRIPESWEVSYIRELSVQTPNAVTAGPFGTIFKAKDFRETGIPIIQLRHITENGFEWGTKKNTFMDTYVYEEYHKPYRVNGGDVLITKLGDPPGLSVIYPDHFEFGMVTPDVIKVTPDISKVNTTFLLNYYNSPFVRRILVDLTRGGTRPRMSMDDFFNLPIILPPIKEQNEIADIIASIDNRVIKKNSFLLKNQLFKKALMNDLLTGRKRVKV